MDISKTYATQAPDSYGGAELYGARQKYRTASPFDIDETLESVKQASNPTATPSHYYSSASAENAPTWSSTSTEAPEFRYTTSTARKKVSLSDLLPKVHDGDRYFLPEEIADLNAAYLHAKK